MELLLYTKYELIMAGIDYGKRHGNAIRGFLSQEKSIICSNVKNHTRLLYSCIPFIKKYSPKALLFYQGISKGSRLKLEDLLLLALHEEYFHLAFSEFMTHCSLIVAQSRNQVLIGQNWDWPCRYSAWGKIETIDINSSFSILTYHYPGLPVCIAVNTIGIAIAWTGAGYFPPIKPKPGVPTYLILLELMLGRSLSENITYLQNVPRSGASIVTIADDKGRSSLLEISPGAVQEAPPKKIETRANHFQLKKMIKLSKQHECKGTKSGKRIAHFESLRTKTYKVSIKSIKEQLLHRKIFVDDGLSAMTIQSFIVQPSKKTIITRCGGTDLGQKWKKFSL
jgi:hypothetical protein